MSGKIHFGVYELDRDAMELRKHGALIRLQEQPFRVLAILAGRPGEIVTREELQEQIWGNVFVDFDQSLNKAVNRVREALNDNAGTPQYVETVPRRGYRFIAPVAAPPQTEAQGPVVTVSPGPAPAPAQRTSHRSPSRIGIIAALATASVLAAIGISVWLKQPKKPALQEPRLITSSGCCPTLSRDGKLLAYSSSSGDLDHIMVQQTAGGEAIPVSTDPYETMPAFSPDGTRIAFYSGKNGGGIYITPTLPGEPRQLTASPTNEWPEFSPGGDTILYGKDHKAFTAAVEGGPPVALSLNKEFRIDSGPFWAPNGKEILFYGVRSPGQNAPADLGVRSPGQSKSADWWIAPLAGGQPQPAHLPGVAQDYDVRAWVRTADDREWIIYSTFTHESWKLWRIGISPRGAVDENPELLLSGNGRLGVVSVSEDGKLAYDIWSNVVSIYQISISDRGEKLGSTLQLPLPEGGSYGSPSVSRDGKWMAYNSYQPGKPRKILLRDLSTRADHLVDDKGRRPGFDAETSISPDGSRVIFERECKAGTFAGFPENPVPCSFMVAAASGEPEQVCERCTPRGFSADGSVVLIQKYHQTHPTKDRIVALDLRTRTERDFLSLPDRPLYHPFFSWDDRWVVFKSQIGQTAQIMIAPVRHGAAASEAEWIAVTDGRNYDDKPQFSPDGNTVYFTSTRDGYLCIWAQRLDPTTKHPMSAPFAYEHFHNSAGRSSERHSISTDLSVARDKILINLREDHFETWMT
jgi:eukaryotic-like serine/threonine-protein kinase